MGDRANVKVVDGESKVYLYTHWGGSELGEDLKRALDRGKDRWEDGPYLARIIFCTMVEQSLMDLTGYGISSVVCDGDDRVYVVDAGKQTVTFMNEEKGREIQPPCSFADFCAARVEQESRRE